MLTGKPPVIALFLSRRIPRGRRYAQLEFQLSYSDTRST